MPLRAKVAKKSEPWTAEFDFAQQSTKRSERLKVRKRQSVRQYLLLGTYCLISVVIGIVVIKSLTS